MMSSENIRNESSLDKMMCRKNGARFMEPISRGKHRDRYSFPSNVRISGLAINECDTNICCFYWQYCHSIPLILSLSLLVCSLCCSLSLSLIFISHLVQ